MDYERLWQDQIWMTKEREKEIEALNLQQRAAVDLLQCCMGWIEDEELTSDIRQFIEGCAKGTLKQKGGA